ncbi:hypothetical protein [Sphingomonas oryzagri]
MHQRDDRQGGGDPDAQARAISAMVRATERVEGTLAIGLMAICVGLPVIGGIVRGHPVLGLANALLLGLIGWGLVLLVQALLLQPISIVRYHRAADRLCRTLRSTSGVGAMHHSWADAAPGAITVAADGRAWLADRSTDYQPVMLAPESIVHAEAISVTTMAKGGRRRQSGSACRWVAALSRHCRWEAARHRASGCAMPSSFITRSDPTRPFG